MTRLVLDSPADVRLLEKGFSVGDALAAFDQTQPNAGGIVSFLGKVRTEGDVQALELSHYEPLTQSGMRALADTAAQRWPLEGLLVWHRVGEMAPGDPIVLVAAAAKHRRDAFEAADFLMDYLKSAAWFWKREKTPDGWRWIEPREQDYSDRARWE